MSLNIKDSHREQSNFGSRVIVLFFFIIIAMIGLFFRMFQLQVLEFDTFQTKAEENRIQIQPIAPPRGLIYDRHGILLADNRPIHSLTLVQERVNDLDESLRQLGELVVLLDEDIEGFHERLKRRRRPFEPVVVKLHLEDDEIARIAVNRHRLPGIGVKTQLVRHYPLGAIFAHAVGSVRRVTEDDLRRLDPVRYSATKFVGRRGIEQFYENSLHGEVGHQKVETDARGRIRSIIDVEPPTSGQNITLHMDSRLQIAAAAALGDRRGAVVAIAPKSGGVLALVSNPGYDPNLFVTGISRAQYQELTQSRETPLFNRATRGQYAPGSTFKPIVGLAAISLKKVTWNETIEDHGWFQLPHQTRIYRDWSWKKNNSGGQGLVDFHRAIYRSSNVFFYDIATRLDIDDLAKFAGQFGYGRVTSIDIAGAAAGILPNRVWKYGARGEPWYPGDNVNVGIGQGDLLATPLQLATAVSVIANRGKFVRPRMLLASDEPLEEVQASDPIANVQGLVDADWENIINAMVDVVHRGNKGFRQNGTAWAYIGRNIAYRMAGKSGTAQVVEIKQGEEYDEEELDEYNRKHAWFIAFAPADDPLIAVCVLVENGGGGSSVAAPVAREVLDAFLLPQLSSVSLSSKEASQGPSKRSEP